MRKKGFRQVVLNSRPDMSIEDWAWINTEGDSPIKFEKMINSYGWLVTYEPDKPNSPEKEPQ